MKFLSTLACAACMMGLASHARADITVGVLLSQTGPAASLGIPERNTVEVLRPTLGGQKVRLVVLDDASDTTTAVRLGKKLVDEDKVDVILGPTITPTSLALLPVVGAAQTPMISLAGSGSVVIPAEGDRRWAFKLAPNESTMGEYIFESMKAKKQKTLAYIAFATAFGESFVKEMDKLAPKYDVKIVANERYLPTDTSVTAQALKVMATNPDAVLIAASGTPAAQPVTELKKRGYKGQIYLQQGVANPDFLRVGGRDLDGSLFPVSPVLVAEQLPDANPVKKPAIEYVKAFEGKYGPGTRSLFGATLWDAWILLDKSVPVAMKAAKPGTAEFRKALRDALERSGEVVAAQGVFNLSEKDHNGTDRRAQVLVRIENGKWVLVP
jgi:branched-chain amino acid transport system substrate-binding protein